MNEGLRGGGGDTHQNVVKDIAPSLGADPSGGNTREFSPRERSVQNIGRTNETGLAGHGGIPPPTLDCD